MPSPANQPPSAPPPSSHRQRLVDGLASALLDRAYADVTVAHIVASAHVSRRTFYEHFRTKEDVLLALCEDFSERMLSLLVHGYQHQDDWVQQLRQVTLDYLVAMQSQPVLLKVLFIELLTLGPRGWQLRRQIHERFADFIRLQVEVARLQEPGKRPMSPALAMAVVGGINELIMQAIEQDRVAQLSALAPTASELVESVLRSLEPQPGS